MCRIVELSNITKYLYIFKQLCLAVFALFGCLAPCWFPLVFWNIHFGIYFKLGLKFSYKLTEFFFSGHWNFSSVQDLVSTEKKIQLVYSWNFFSVWNKCQNGYFKKLVEINRGLRGQGCWYRLQTILRKRFRTESKNYGQSFSMILKKHILLFGSNIFILEGTKK